MAKYFLLGNILLFLALQAGLLTIIGSIGLLILLGMTPHSPANQTKRLWYLTGFAFLSGIGLGPLMDLVIRIDPRLANYIFNTTNGWMVVVSKHRKPQPDYYYLFLMRAHVFSASSRPHCWPLQWYLFASPSALSWLVTADSSSSSEVCFCLDSSLLWEM